MYAQIGWQIHPEPIADETFSSWFRRLAAANGLSARELYRALMPGAQLFAYDLDRHACPNLISTLSEETGQSADHLNTLMLHRWDGLVGSSVGCSDKMLWRPPAGRERSIRSFGQQICTRCLEEDYIPYYRSTWRLSFHTVCTKHHIYLSDRCHSCGEPVQILKSDAIEGTPLRCWRCNTDFRGYCDAAPANSNVTVEPFFRAIKDHWVRLPGYGHVHSVVYFDIINSLFRLLVSGCLSERLRHSLSVRLNNPSLIGTSIPRLKEAERLNPRSRYIVLDAILQLLQDWPVTFTSACRDEGITARHLIKGNRVYPFPFMHAIETYLTKGSVAVTGAEVANAARHLMRANIRPTRSKLEEVLGSKFSAGVEHVAPARDCNPYGTSRYWKLDGVSPEVRAAAKAAAKNRGENVGAWVDYTLRRVLTENSQ